MATSSIAYTGSELSVSVVRTGGELPSLGREWNELFQGTGCQNVFLSFEWMSKWWAQWGQDHQVFVVSVHDDDHRLVGLAPLYVSRHGGPLRLRRLGLIGDQFVGSDHLDLLVEHEIASTVLDRMCEFILSHRAEWDYIEFEGVRDDSIAVTAFYNRLQAAGMSALASRSATCPYTELPQDAEDYLAHLKPRFRQNLKYSLRSLEREGPVEFVSVQTPEEMESALEALFRLHGERFAERGEQSAFLTPDARQFQCAAAQLLSGREWAQIYQLRFRGETIGALYGFSIGRKFSFYQAGFDPTYRRFSIGSLLISHAIQSAIRAGHTEFDFLRGDEPYKQNWATRSRKLYRISLFDHRAMSRLAKAYRVLRDRLRSSKAAIGPALARFKLSALRASFQPRRKA